MSIALDLGVGFDLEAPAVASHDGLAVAYFPLPNRGFSGRFTTGFSTASGPWLNEVL